MTVQLPEDLQRYVQLKVASGRFASEDEAISEAVRLLRQQEGASPPAAGMPSGKSKLPPAPEPAWKRVLDMMQDVPDEVFDTIPVDSSEQLDHYLYGAPKKSNT